MDGMNFIWFIVGILYSPVIWGTIYLFRLDKPRKRRGGVTKR